jgi:hypothetical protein
MMTALIVTTDAKRIGQHQCQSWTECQEWSSMFIGYNGLKRLRSHKANGQLITWVEPNETKS